MRWMRLTAALVVAVAHAPAALAADCSPGSFGGVPGPVITGTPTSAEIPTAARPVFRFAVAAGTCPVERIELLIDGQPSSGPLPLDATSWQPDADLPDGAYTWRLRATDTSGSWAESGVPFHGARLPHVLVIDTTAPQPVQITAPAAGATFRWRYVWPTLRWTRPEADVVRAELFLNGRSLGPQSGVSAGELRLDGITPGSPITLRLDVTDQAGHRTQGVPRTFVYAADAAIPEDGPIGVSIEDGAAATNDPRVALHVIWKEAPEARILIANDGGFQPAAGARRVWAQRHVPWLLVPGGGLGTRTVYVRMPGADGRLATFVDDILYDPVRPVVASATALARHRVRLRAGDGSSGVAAIQVDAGGHLVTFTLRPTGALGLRRVSRTLALRATPRRVRVRDAAGNWSRWRVVAHARAALPGSRS